MEFTLGELAAKIGAAVVKGDTARRIAGVSNLAEAGPAELAPFTDAKYAGQLATTMAGAILIKKGVPPAVVPDGTALLEAADAEMAFLHAVQICNPEKSEVAGVHPTAVIEQGAKVAADVYVGPLAVI